MLATVDEPLTFEVRLRNRTRYLATLSSPIIAFTAAELPNANRLSPSRITAVPGGGSNFSPLARRIPITMTPRSRRSVSASFLPT